MSLNPVHSTRVMKEESLTPHSHVKNHALEGNPTTIKASAVFTIALATLIGTMIGGPILGLACALFFIAASKDHQKVEEVYAEKVPAAPLGAYLR